MALAKAGMNIARINMSHGDRTSHCRILSRIKKINRRTQFPIGVLLDTRGPEIRTSSSTEIGLEEGDHFKIAVSSNCDFEEGEKHTLVNYKKIIHKVKKHEIILIDDGLIALKVIDIKPYYLDCKVLNSAKLGTRKSVNLPGVKIDLPAVSKKERDDLLYLLSHFTVDFIAQSFVRKKRDILDMRRVLKKAKSEAFIIAKIENQEGVDNTDDIIEHADGVMVARGDLGVELPFEKIPIIQRMLVEKCITAGKPVVIATQMLESMIVNSRPTRAEVTDIANAVYQKADCIMLSAETAKGAHPLECVKTMHTVGNTVQEKLQFEQGNAIRTDDVKEALTLGACINAENLGARAIIVFSKTGRLVRMITKNRPNINIFAFTESDDIKRRLMIYWSTFAFTISFREHIETMVATAIAILKKNELLEKGDRVIIVSDVNPNKKVDTLEVREI